MLIAICDAKYYFTLFNMGGYSSNSGSGILAKFHMNIRSDSVNMSIPGAKGFAGFPAEKPHII